MSSLLTRRLLREAAVCLAAWFTFLALVLALRHHGERSGLHRQQTRSATSFYRDLTLCSPASTRPASPCSAHLGNAVDRGASDSEAGLPDPRDEARFYRGAYAASYMFGLPDGDVARVRARIATLDGDERAQLPPLLASLTQAKAPPASAPDCTGLAGGPRLLCDALADPALRARIEADAQARPRETLQRLLALTGDEIASLADPTRYGRISYYVVEQTDGLSEYDRPDPELLSLLHDTYLRQHYGDGPEISSVALLSDLLQRSLVQSFAASLLYTAVFSGLVMGCVLLLVYLLTLAHLQRSAVARLAALLAVPTFAVGALLRRLTGDVNLNPTVGYLLALGCAVAASGVAFELFQFFRGLVDRQLDEAHVMALRTLGFRNSDGSDASDRAGPASVLAYVGVLVRDIGSRRNRQGFSSSPLLARRLFPFLFRGAENDGLHFLGRRLPSLLDGLIIVGVMFGLSGSVGNYFLDCLVSGDLVPLVQGVTGVLALAFAFKAAGTVIHHRLFT